MPVFDFGFLEISAYWMFWITSLRYLTLPLLIGFQPTYRTLKEFHSMHWVLQSFLLFFVVKLQRIGRPKMNMKLLVGIETNVGKVASEYIHLNEKVSFLLSLFTEHN